ncbi:MAG: SDR family oxidoreductase [Betaproteobacteria bacterium]|nr:SDR family oxidoreductase [Betaproteobacteria bacterium]
MKLQAGQTAVITGAASGFGLEFSLQAAQRGLNVVMSDVQVDALEAAAQRVRATGVQVLACAGDIAQACVVEALVGQTLERFGAPHLLFNNAGVAHGGLIWEHTERDWDWVLGVNLRGVAHGVRLFTPEMLKAAERDAGYQGHIINTASMAGLVCAPNMGVYNVTKHAVVALTETLQQDLSLVTDQVRASVLCPYFVPTGISHSHRNRPSELRSSAKPTQSQLIAQAMSEKAVSSGKVTAADVALATYRAIEAGQFYIYSHPNALAPVQTRMEDVLLSRNPSDPFKDRPEIGQRLRAALRGGGAG